MRATAVLGWLLVILAGTAAAQTAPRSRPGLPVEDAFLGIGTYRLWADDAPGAVGKGELDVPSLTLFRPHVGTANGTAIVVAPGGAYLGLAANLEGRQVADYFAARGVTAFVLRYRLGRKYLYPTPLLDAQRAIRLVRSRAGEFGIAPDRIGMMGFSAGGHLTAAAGTMFDGGKADAPDPIERASSRPDFLVLGYPWLNAMQKDQKGVISYCSVLEVEAEKCSSFEQYSPSGHVSAKTPPTFIYHTTDDELVPVDASVSFYRLLAAAGVPVEMHVFGKGRHGSGLGLGDPALDAWPTLLETWLRGRGLLTPDPALAAQMKRLLEPAAPRKPGEAFSVDLPLGDLLANPGAKAVLVKHLGSEYVEQIGQNALRYSLRSMTLRDPAHVSAALVASIDSDLKVVPR